MFVKATVSFNKSKNIILKLIREPGNLYKYHPFCKRNDAITWPGNNSEDQLEYLNGLTFNRKLFNWSDNGYDLEIGKNKKMAIVNWIVEGNNSHSSLTIRINPEIRNYVPVENKCLQYLLWFLYVKPKLQSYINHVVKGFDFYINNNERVKHNQFGKHSWFS